MVERGVNLNNGRSFHRKILIFFADNIGLNNYFCFSKIEGSIIPYVKYSTRINCSKNYKDFSRRIN